MLLVILHLERKLPIWSSQLLKGNGLRFVGHISHLPCFSCRTEVNKQLCFTIRRFLQDATVDQRSDIEEFVWSSHKPWMPRPLLSMHVRMGDKACEMKVVEFEEYMGLAGRIRKRFPQLKSVWLSTEMQV